MKSDSFCWMCEATQKTLGPLHFHDFRPEAAHRQTMISHESYLTTCAQEGEQPSHLLRCPGFMMDFVTVDVMHAGDLGTFQDAIGSLLWLEITNKSWFPNKGAGLQALNVQLADYYSANPGLSKVTPLTMSQIFTKEPGYPYLKAKAAQTRHLVGFCLTLAHLHRTGHATRPAFRFRRHHRLEADSARHCDLVVALFEGLNRFVGSCGTTPFVAADCRAGMYQYLQCMEELHRMWRRDVPLANQKPLPWHLRPKAHVCQHMVEEKIDMFGSPSEFWCYRDEDFVGVIKSIAAKTKHPATLEAKLVHKLRIWAALSTL